MAPAVDEWLAGEAWEQQPLPGTHLTPAEAEGAARLTLSGRKPLQLSWPMKPCKVPAILMYFHFRTFELIQLFANGSLVLRC